MSGALYFVTGVCGVGKTSIIPRLKSRLPSNQFRIHDLDERGVPDGGGRVWRLAETQHWIDEAAVSAQAGISTIICGFANPEELPQLKTENLKVEYILLDADAETIRRRLTGRYEKNDSFAEVKRVTGSSIDEFVQSNVSFSSVLREICKKWKCVNINTDEQKIEDMADQVADQILRNGLG